MKLPLSILTIFFACSVFYASTKHLENEQKKEPFVSEIASDTDYNVTQVSSVGAADFSEESSTNMTTILSTLSIVLLIILFITLKQNNTLERKYQRLVSDFKTKKSQT